MRVIHQSAFCLCKNLKYVVINDGLETLGIDEYTDDGVMWYGVFGSSTLEYVELPSTLKRIEYSAFDECKYLKSI